MARSPNITQIFITLISCTAASLPFMSRVLAVSPPLTSWLVMVYRVPAPWSNCSMELNSRVSAALLMRSVLA